MQKFGGISNYFYNLIYNLNNNTKNDIEVFAPLYINNYLDLLPKKIEIFYWKNMLLWMM